MQNYALHSSAQHCQLLTKDFLTYFPSHKAYHKVKACKPNQKVDGCKITPVHNISNCCTRNYAYMAPCKFSDRSNHKFVLFWFVYLNSLSIDVHDPLSEVHPDGGVGSAGELPGAEAVSEAGLPDPGVPDHDHLKGPAAGRQRRGRAAERV